MTDLADGSELKVVFRDGWSNQDRVDNWVAGSITREFGEPRSRAAWCSVLGGLISGNNVEETLDIGTGPGTIAQLWAELGCASTGLDFSKPMIEAGRKGAAERGLDITFVEGDAEHPPFLPGSFDLVSSRFLLYTLPHPGYALRRWTELIRPDGLMVLIGHEKRSKDREREPKRKPPAAKPKMRWRPDEEYRKALDRLHFLDHTPDTLMVVMEATGLRDIRRMPVDDIVSAQTALLEREGSHELFKSIPYILVGRKSE